MAKARSPRAKKQLELARDHRVLALAGTKTFRKGWPRKKALAKRGARRAERVALGAGNLDPEDADLAVRAAQAKLRTRRPKKVGVFALGDTLQIQAERSLRWGAATHTEGKPRAAAKLRREKASR
jgi:hypothetical protein